MQLPKEVKKLADFIVTKMKDVPELGSRSPNSLAAAAISWACDLTNNGQLRTMEEISKICGAAENTIKQAKKLMENTLDSLVPADFKTVAAQYMRSKV